MFKLFYSIHCSFWRKLINAFLGTLVFSVVREFFGREEFSDVVFCCSGVEEIWNFTGAFLIDSVSIEVCEVQIDFYGIIESSIEIVTFLKLHFDENSFKACYESIKNPKKMYSRWMLMRLLRNSRENRVA